MRFQSEWHEPVQFEGHCGIGNKGYIASQEVERGNHTTVICSAMEGLLLNVVINIQTKYL